MQVESGTDEGRYHEEGNNIRRMPNMTTVNCGASSFRFGSENIVLY